MIEKVQEIKFPKIDENIVVFFNKNNKFMQNQVKRLQEKLKKTKLKNYFKLITINTYEKKFNFESFSKSKTMFFPFNSSCGIPACFFFFKSIATSIKYLISSGV